MKKTKILLTSLVLAAVMSLGLMACSAQSATTSDDESADASSTEAVEIYRNDDGTVDVSKYSQTDPYVADEVCLACHGGTYEAVAELTADLGEDNPHDSIHGGYWTCDTCHSNGSEITYNKCTYCHDWPTGYDCNPYDNE